MDETVKVSRHHKTLSFTHLRNSSKPKFWTSLSKFLKNDRRLRWWQGHFVTIYYICSNNFQMVELEMTHLLYIFIRGSYSENLKFKSKWTRFTLNETIFGCIWFVNMDMHNKCMENNLSLFPEFFWTVSDVIWQIKYKKEALAMASCIISPHFRFWNNQIF